MLTGDIDCVRGLVSPLFTQLVYHWTPHCVLCFFTFIHTGCVPLDPSLSRSVEEGKSFIETFEKSPARQSVLQVVTEVMHRTQDKEDNS